MDLLVNEISGGEVWERGTLVGYVTAVGVCVFPVPIEGWCARKGAPSPLRCASVYCAGATGVVCESF